MTRNRVLLALLASSVIFLHSAPAQAKPAAPAKIVKQHRAQVGANCTFGMTAPWVDAWNYVNVNGYISSCTAVVTKVKFMWDPQHTEGFWDKSECPGCVYGNLRPYQLSSPAVPLTINSVVPSGVYGVTFKTYGWCSPGGVHQIFSGMWVQIYNGTTGTWGTPKDYIAGPTSTHCGNI